MTFQRNKLSKWVGTYFKDDKFEIEFLAGDASFRRYYRIKRGSNTYVLMDASSEKEKLTQFLKIGKLFRENGVITPLVIYSNLEDGISLLSDFGDQLLIDNFQKNKEISSYKNCLDELIKINQIKSKIIPSYTHEKLIEEMTRMQDWFFELLKIKLSKSDKVILANLFDQLASALKSEPQVCLHRDYHCKNIMPLGNDLSKIGIIDFQDAVCGPVTYDLVSLLKDCYIDWPKDETLTWVKYYFNLLREKELISESISFKQFLMWFDLTGLQRHIKCLGIFSCLYIRDGRSQYLEYLPRVFNYILSASKDYEALKDWNELLIEKIKPQFDQLNLNYLKSLAS